MKAHVSIHAQEVSPYAQAVTDRCTMINHTDQSAAHVSTVISVGPAPTPKLYFRCA